MRILVVAPALPVPPLTGAPLRNYHVLRQLARRHDVSLLGFGTRADAESPLLRDLDIRVHAVPSAPAQGGRKRRAQLASLLSTASFQRRIIRSAAMQRAIDDRLAGGAFDVVQVELSQMGNFDFRTSALVVLDEHNLDYEILERMARTERSAIRRGYSRIEALKVRREERRAWRRVDACVVTSERERAVVGRQLPGRPIAVVPNGVDLDLFSVATAAPRPASMVFTGAIDYRPNSDAVVYFVREIFPLILREQPQSVFTVVGMRPPPEVTRLAGPNVVITGQVPDVRPFVRQAAVVVAPLRMGSGTRLKLLEAMAQGKPIVSTSMGHEGLAVVAGEHLLVADTPRGFADHVLRLFDDAGLARRLGRNARALTERAYGWDATVSRLDRFLSSLVAERMSGQPAASVGLAS